MFTLVLRVPGSPQTAPFTALRCCLGLLLFSAAAMLPYRPLAAAESGETAREEFFEKQIRPLLLRHCTECHGVEEQNGGLRLDRRSAFFAGGDSGPAVVAGKPEQSRLIAAVRYRDADLQMPPEGKLPPEAIALLARWIQDGASWPAEAGAPAPTGKTQVPPAERIDELRAEHWSYQPIRKPELPRCQDASWARTPIDHFVLARLDEAGLEPNPKADRRTLIRRAYFTLIGLPPTYEQVEAFANNESPQAFDDVIETLLASPHYGERWARHWLDIARYSDTMGYMGVGAETRYPYAYTYRDWVIDALNNDKPYDRFIMEQLAADQLPLGRDERKALAAMGFLNVGRRFRGKTHDIIDDRIDVVCRGFLGLSVSCARCHDHKYDPIPTADYYSLYGVFASSYEPEELPLLQQTSSETPEQKAFERELAARKRQVSEWMQSLQTKIEEELRSRVADYLVHHARTLPQYDTGDVKQQGKRGYLRPQAIARWQAYLQSTAPRNHPVWNLYHELAELPREQFAEQSQALLARCADAKGRPFQVNDLLLAALVKKAPKSMPVAAEVIGSELEAIYARWKALQQKDASAKQLEVPAAEALRQEIYAAVPLSLDTEQTRKHFTQGERGQHRKLTKQVQALEFSHPGAPGRAMVMLDKEQPHEPVIFRRGQPGNRGHRVPRRFLQVLSHVDGGRLFTDGSGRLQLARAIASAKNPLTARVMINRIWQHHFGHGLVRTPSNFGIRGEKPTHPELLDYLAARFIQEGWSMKQMHRLIMRSAVWQQASIDRAAARQLDPENRLLWKMQRQRLQFEPLRDALLLVAGKLDRRIGGRSVPIHKDANRRGVYAFVDREDMPGLLASFDVPNPDATTAVRARTTVPQQALFLMNAPLVIDQAKALAARTAAEDAAARVIRLYRLALARNPTSQEQAVALAFLQEHEAASPEPGEQPSWRFGYGHYDPDAERVKHFAPLRHFTGSAWQASGEFPDPKLHYLRLTANGGHPGIDAGHAVIRRWIVPQAGTMRIRGLLEHREQKGNGVQAWIVSDAAGQLGYYQAHNSEAETVLKDIQVAPGEVIDFVLDGRGNHGWDGFRWAPVIEFAAKQSKPPGRKAIFDAAADFEAASRATPRQPALTPLEQLAQVLLLSNEFAFVD